MSELSFGPFINKYLHLIHEQFKNIPETNNGRTNNISLTDSLGWKYVNPIWIHNIGIAGSPPKRGWQIQIKNNLDRKYNAGIIKLTLNCKIILKLI